VNNVIFQISFTMASNYQSFELPKALAFEMVKITAQD
jgi:hypothetical protein